MKVVLKKAVAKLGIPGEIVEVKPGFAFNFLIPQGIALFANEKNVAEFEAKKAEFLKEHEALKSVAEKIKSTLEGKFILMEKTVNDAGNFYAVINSTEVAEELNKQFKQDGLEFTKSHIVISNKIRSHGIYDVTINLYHGVSSKMKLAIAANKEAAAQLINDQNQQQ